MAVRCFPTPVGPAKIRLGGRVSRAMARASSSSSGRCPVIARNGMGPGANLSRRLWRGGTPNDEHRELTVAFRQRCLADVLAAELADVVSARQCRKRRAG